jgi:hypothetical protein
MKRAVWFLRVTSIVIFSIFIYDGCMPLHLSPPDTRPVILHAFIPKKEVTYGDVLRIYIEAEDPEGYMFKIHTVVDQAGHGRYFPDTIFVKPEDQHHLIGYLQWNTFSSKASYMQEWTQVVISVSVADTSGKESQTVTFPIEFVSEATPQTPLPPPFDQGKLPRLGHIFIDLVNPHQVY